MHKAFIIFLGFTALRRQHTNTCRFCTCIQPSNHQDQQPTNAFADIAPPRFFTTKYGFRNGRLDVSILRMRKHAVRETSSGQVSTCILSDSWSCVACCWLRFVPNPSGDWCTEVDFINLIALMRRTMDHSVILTTIMQGYKTPISPTSLIFDLNCSRNPLIEPTTIFHRHV